MVGCWVVIELYRVITAIEKYWCREKESEMNKATAAE